MDLGGDGNGTVNSRRRLDPVRFIRNRILKTGVVLAADMTRTCCEVRGGDTWPGLSDAIDVGVVSLILAP